MEAGVSLISHQILAASSELTPARSQMAFTLGFHIILACLGVAFPALMLIANYIGLKRDDPVALGRVRAEGDQVVVVERDPPRAELGEAVHRLDRVEGRAGGVTERVAGGPADRPEPEAEAVLTGGLRHGKTPLFGHRTNSGQR